MLRSNHLQLLLLLPSVAQSLAIAYQVVQILLLGVEPGVQRTLFRLFALQVRTTVFTFQFHLRKVLLQLHCFFLQALNFLGEASNILFVRGLLILTMKTLVLEVTHNAVLLAFVAPLEFVE